MSFDHLDHQDATNSKEYELQRKKHFENIPQEVALAARKNS